MNLTKQQAIYEHRKMWNWIADETLKRGKKVKKEDYFLEHLGKYPRQPHNKCWCCEYTSTVHEYVVCSKCPIEWDGDVKISCCDNQWATYRKWLFTEDYIESAGYAREIAEFPERIQDEENL